MSYKPYYPPPPECYRGEDSPMPIIGVYIAAASLLCSIAMFLNSCFTFINSFPNFNVRFFPLNATWLTLLAVATKLATDLTTPKLSYLDNQAKIMNTVFLTVAMSNFFTSLGSMNNADILTNLTALSILVITVIVDLCLQLSFRVFGSLSLVIIFQIALLFCAWITIVCTGLAVPAIKKRAESKYQKLASDERQMETGQQHYSVEELRLSITKYWVMAASGSPQLLMKRVDKLVEMGKKQQPKHLFNFLDSESFSFAGVVDFDSNRVPSLLSGEPPNCWTLPVVTLTSIAIALPNIASRHVDWLVSSANEGLRYASLIDVLDGKCGSKSIKNAADVVWVGVELHRKWLDMDLKRKTGEISSVKDIIQDLNDVSERIVMEFSSKENIMIVENPLYWPPNVLAANSMYRITRTILLYYGDGECQAEELFRKLICMIANILVVCLTNLPHMIYTKCISSAIEERLESVRDAAIIFGETEDILKLFEELKLSSIGPSQPLCIDEWRRWIQQQATTISSSATSNGASSVESNEHVVLQMHA
nr:uncharacterized protein LOC109157637 [Ipomoea trifida]